jgi:hypothetical protein
MISQLEANWLPGLMLQDGSTGDDMLPVDYIHDTDPHEITGVQLAVYRKIEQGKVSDFFRDL